MSLRTRTIVAAAATTMLAVAVLGLALDVLVARHLRGELDQSLRTRAIGVAQLAASAPALLTTPGALVAPAGGTQALVEVVDARRRIVARSLSLGGRVLPETLAAPAPAGATPPSRTPGLRGPGRRRGSAALPPRGVRRRRPALLRGADRERRRRWRRARRGLDLGSLRHDLDAARPDAARRADRGRRRGRRGRAPDAACAAAARASRPRRGRDRAHRRPVAAPAGPAPRRRGRPARDDAQLDARQPRALARVGAPV